MNHVNFGVAGYILALGSMPLSSHTKTCCLLTDQLSETKRIFYIKCFDFSVILTSVLQVIKILDIMDSVQEIDHNIRYSCIQAKTSDSCQTFILVETASRNLQCCSKMDWFLIFIYFCNFWNNFRWRIFTINDEIIFFELIAGKNFHNYYVLLRRYFTD